MFEAVGEMLSFPFMLRAMIAGPLIAVCLSLLGVTMVLKRFSMIGDGLSHVAFGALAVASALGTQPLAVGIPVVAASSVFLLRLSENSKLRGDSAIALISTSALAVGVTAVSMTKGMNVDVWNYLFGSILSLKSVDVTASAVLAVITILIYTAFYNRIFSTTFDENFSAAVGIGVGRYKLLVAILASIVILVGMRMVGSLLISSLIVFPAMSSMRIFGSYKKVVFASVIISVLCTLSGIIASYFLNTPAGASIVLCNLAVFIAASFMNMLRFK